MLTTTTKYGAAHPALIHPPTGEFDGLQLGAIVGQIEDLRECESRDYDFGGGECADLIGSHFDNAIDRVLAAHGLDREAYERAIAERLPEASYLAYCYASLV